MQEGTVAMFMQLRGEKPPPTKTELAEIQQDGSLVTIYVYPDGHFGFTVEENGVPLLSYETAPVHLNFEGVGKVLFMLTWGEDKRYFEINGKEIPAAGSSNKPVSIQLKTEDLGEQAVGHPEARERCEKWIEWRKEKYGDRKNFQNHRVRAVTHKEQIEHLRTTIQLLEDFVKRSAENEAYFPEVVSTGLRALLDWQGRNNPLLLRLATRVDPPLPLPLFAFNTSLDEQPDILKEASMHYRDNAPSLQRRYPKHELMDLQAWLTNPVLTERFVSEATGDRVEQSVSPLYIIRKTGSMAGLAHFKEIVVRELDRLKTSKTFGNDLLFQFLARTSVVVIGLSKYVLSELESAGSG